MRVDLHLHSTASDGTLEPAALVRAALAGGLHIIALTDHDTTAGCVEAAAAGAGSLHVIAGIEISTTHLGRELHVLGYFVDPLHDSMTSHETAAAARRSERMIDILDALRPHGIRIDLDDVKTAAGTARVVARPHLARILVERGHADSIADAFERLIGDACPAYRPVDLLTPAQAIDRIHAAGGIAVWAHPETGTFKRDIRKFFHLGLDGVECYRPRIPPDESLFLERTSTGLGLLVTGGSDWHGHWNGRLGTFSLGREEVGAFLTRGGI